MSSAIQIYKKNPSPAEQRTSLINSSDGAGLHFDGSGSIDGTSNLALGSKYSAEFVVNYTGSDGNRLFDVSGDTRFIVEFNRTGFTGKIAGYDSAYYEICDIPDNDVFHLVVTVDGSAVSAYINGNLAGTATKNNSTSIDTVTQWAIGANRTGSGSEFEGTIYRARFYNKTLTSAEVQTAFERSDVPFADQYGRQAVNDGGFTSASNWLTNGGWSVASNKATFTASGGTGRVGQNSVFTAADVGKQVHITFTVGASTGTIWIGNSSGTTQYVDGGYNSYTVGTHTVTFTLPSSETTLGFYSQYASSGSWEISNVGVHVEGAVVDLDLAFANPSQSRTIQDRSTNNVDGTASTSGVTQVQKVVQLNSTSARIGTTAATPADGQVIGDKITTTNAIQLERVSEYTAKLSCVDSGGNQTLQILGNRAAGSGSSGTDVLIGGQQNRTTGNVLRVDQGSDTYLTISSSGNVDIPTANAALTIGSTAANGSPSLKLCEQTASGDISNGFSFNVDGAGTNNLHIKRHVVSASGTDALVIDRDSGLTTFSNGINLGDTNLSNYAEGTWSPVFAGDSTAGTYTHSTTATYTRIGNQVTVYCSLVNITETSAGSGSIKISGLPFASASGGQGYTSASRVRQYSSAVGPFYALVSPTASYVNLMYYVNGSTDAPAPISGLSSGNTDITFTLTYFV